MNYDEFVNKAKELKINSELGECIYIEAIKQLTIVQNDLQLLDDVKHVKRIIKPFLSQWGMMVRIAGRKNIEWDSLGVTLRSLENKFSVIRDEKILSIDLSDPKIHNSISKIYSELGKIKYIGGPTSVSKILHLFNPEVFVMWDNDIKKKYKEKNKKISSSVKGYLEFLKCVQSELSEMLEEQSKKTGLSMNEIEDKLIEKFNGLTLARIIDMYNWITAHPLSN